ncbi:DNA-(apurinic or apyrimidinic site) endonuclease 2-like protein [Drosera capensis]
MEGHSLISCHVKDCDIMTEFGRWKPGITPRWNGGRSTKLEGSDHVPVYAVLKDIPDIPAHSTPLLSARYIPEIRGFQQNIVSMLMKRKDAKEVTMSCMASCSTSQQAPKLMLCENTKTSARDCSLSSIDSVQYFSSGLVAKESDMKISETGGFAVIIEQECSRSLPNPQKNKKAKPTQPSQRTLKSFFQRVPNLANGGSDSTKVNTSHDEVDSSNSQYDHFMGTPELDQISGMAGKSDDNIRAEEEEREVACTPTQEDKKHASLMEWRRIQERMQASIPLCVGHKEPCVARVVKKQGPNFGRRFYVCARAEGPASNPETRCDFFKWAASKPKNR